MPKDRLNIWDIKALVHDLGPKIIGKRISNIYDIDSKIFIFKFTKPDTPKAYLIVEPGIRIHSSQYNRDVSKTISGFSLKLRKHLKNLRCENILQTGMDRVILMQFATGEICLYIILEFYSSGNIILTDYKFNIIALTRRYELNELKVTVGSIYTINSLSNHEFIFNKDELKTFLLQYIQNSQQEQNNNKKKKKDFLISNVIMKFNEITSKFNTKYIIHCFMDRGINDENIFDIDYNDEYMEKLCNSIQSCYNLYLNLIYFLYPIIVKSTDGYSDVSPILLNQMKTLEYDFIDNYDSCLDLYYSQFDIAKADKEQSKEKSIIYKKYLAIKEDQESRINTLTSTINTKIEQSQYLEYYHEDVDKLIFAIQSMIASQKSWDFIRNYSINEKQLRPTSIFNIYKSINFDTNELVVQFQRNSDLDNEDSTDDPVIEVPLSFLHTSYQNLSLLYTTSKSQSIKLQKTKDIAEHIIKKSDKETQKKLNTMEQKNETVQIRRDPLWFEKFYWFISSENILVFAGRDKLQNEIIVKRYLNNFDIYIHIDIASSPSCVIKTNWTNISRNIPHETIHEACTTTLCHSKLWSDKHLGEIYWVYGFQVSKGAPTGEYIKSGSFMIRGKRNFIKVDKLEMGFGIAFVVSNDDVYRHTNEYKFFNFNHNNSETQKQLPVDNESSTNKNPTEIKSLNPDCKNENTEENSIDLKKDNYENVANKDNDEQLKYPVASSLRHLDEQFNNLIKNNINSNTYEQPDEIQDTNIHIDISETSNDNPKITLNENNPTHTRKQRISRKQRKMMKKLRKEGRPPQTMNKEQEQNDDTEEVTDNIEEGNEVNETSEIICDDLPKEANDSGNEPSESESDDEETSDIKIEQINYNNKKGRKRRLKNRQKIYDEEDRYLYQIATGKISLKKEKSKNEKDQTPVIKPIIVEECYVCNQFGHEPYLCPQLQRQVSETTSDLGGDQPGNITLKDFEIAQRMTGKPSPDDTIQFAVPVCAPLPSLQHYRYKVKLIPGQAKRGKSVQICDSYFIRLANPLEKQFIRSIRNDEMNATMLSNAQVVIDELSGKNNRTKR